MAEKPVTGPPAPAPKLGQGSDAMKVVGTGLSAVMAPLKLLKAVFNPLAAPKIILEVAPGGASLPGVSAAANVLEKAGGIIKNPLSGAGKLGMDAATGKGDPVGAGLDQAAKAGSAAVGAGLKGIGQGADALGTAVDPAAQAAGTAATGAGKALSATLLGAIIGIPLIVAGQATKVGGKVAKVAGKAAKAVSKVAATLAKALIKVLGKLAKLGYKVSKVTLRVGGKALKAVRRTKRVVKRVAKPVVKLAKAGKKVFNAAKKPLRAVRRFQKRVQRIKKRVKKAWKVVTKPVRVVKRTVRIIKAPAQAANSAVQTVNQAAEGTSQAGKGDGKAALRHFKGSWSNLKATGRASKASVTSLKGSPKDPDKKGSIQTILNAGKGAEKGRIGKLLGKPKSLLRKVTRPIRLARVTAHKVIRPIRVLKRKLEPVRKFMHKANKVAKVGAAPVKLAYRVGKGGGQYAMSVGKGIHAISDGQMSAGKGDLGRGTGQAFQGVKQVVARPNLGIRQTFGEAKSATKTEFKKGRTLGGSMESAWRAAKAKQAAQQTHQGPTQIHHQSRSAYRPGLGGPGGLSRQILAQRPNGLTHRPAPSEGAVPGPQKAVQKRLVDIQSGETQWTRQGYRHPFATPPGAPSPSPSAPKAPAPPSGTGPGAPQTPSPTPTATSAPKPTFKEAMGALSKQDPALAGDLARGATQTMLGPDPGLQKSVQDLLEPPKTSLKPAEIDYFLSNRYA